MSRKPQMRSIPEVFTRRQVVAGASALTLLSGVAAPALAGNVTKGSVPARLPTGDVHDFDFFVGRWNSVNHRLKKRWVGSNEWDTFPNTVYCHSHMGGVVNIDEVEFTTQGWSGMTIRTFNLGARQWSLYWVSNRTGELFPPVVGGFTGDRGEFYGDDTDEGRPIKVVFRWTRLGPSEAHWEQAFSLDGKEWETNWRIEHKRVTT